MKQIHANIQQVLRQKEKEKKGTIKHLQGSVLSNYFLYFLLNQKHKSEVLSPAYIHMCQICIRSV